MSHERGMAIGGESKMFKKKIDFQSENLAVPEVHTGEVKDEQASKMPEREEEDEILYDNVAIPEYRPRHKEE